MLLLSANKHQFSPVVLKYIKFINLVSLIKMFGTILTEFG